MSPYINEAFNSSQVGNSDDLKTLFPHIDEDPETLSASLDPFTITTATGFLPLRPPQVDLPCKFRPLQTLAENLPVVKLDGTPGLLSSYQVGLAVDSKKALPDLINEIDTLIAADGRPNLAAVTAVFRDYSFVASAYLLEPCWERWSKGFDGFGLGREVLPRCIAGPLMKTARMRVNTKPVVVVLVPVLTSCRLEINPFMSYAAAYALFNYRFANPSMGASEYSNLKLIRAFEKGLDPSSSEAGFVLTHVDMVKHSAGLIKGTADILNAIGSRSGRDDVAGGLHTVLNTMDLVENSMETMWGHSKPKDYNTYRTFLFGITNQSMFPNGVVYEGENNNQPLFFRGESGANDSIIPLLDHLCQIPMPQNALTDILKDFRNYRPKPHREFLDYVRRRAEDLDVRDYCCGDVETTMLYLRVLDHVRSFRWRHWLFAREYILRRSSHPIASGGSPIVTWLPNQLLAVMDLMCEVWNGIDLSEKDGLGKNVFEMMGSVQDQRVKLGKEVEKWCQERGVAAA